MQNSAQKERELLISALESDENLLKPKQTYKQLDRILKAWASWGNTDNFIRKMFKLGLELPRIKESNDNGYDKHETPEFDEGFLNWFDDLVHTLKPQQADLIKGHAKHLIMLDKVFHGDRKRKERWAKKWGRSQRTYNNQLKAARELLMIGVLKRLG